MFDSHRADHLRGIRLVRTLVRASVISEKSRLESDMLHQIWAARPVEDRLVYTENVRGSIPRPLTSLLDCMCCS